MTCKLRWIGEGEGLKNRGSVPVSSWCMLTWCTVLCVDDRKHNFEGRLTHLADGSGDGHMCLGLYGVLDCGDKEGNEAGL